MAASENFTPGPDAGIFSLAELIATSAPSGSGDALALVVLIHSLTALLHLIVPASSVTVGYACDRTTGRPLAYKLNGLRVMILVVGLAAWAVREGKIDGAILYESYARCAWVANTLGLVLSAVMLDANGAMIRKLQARAGGKGGGGESLLMRLQEQHDCAIVLPPAGATSAGSQLQLQLRGRADAVAHMQKALETQLDVDEHEVSVAQHMVPVIIGKGGATIRRLGEQSGAEFSLDRCATAPLSPRNARFSWPLSDLALAHASLPPHGAAAARPA